MPATEEGPGVLVGSSPAIRELRRSLRALADVPTTVLLTGETGTGKSHAARALHAGSKLADQPFVVADCAALAPTLVESELFGCEPGAFTGARSLRRGRAELAGRGTLVLEEIGDLSSGLQAKLLRLLQDRCFERLGSSRARPFEARVVAATHVDLERAVAAGRFRADLYYRLDVARVHLPPLRERLEDLPELILALVVRLASRLGREAPRVAPGVVEHVAGRAWPGNIRELANALERAMVLSPASELRPEHLQRRDTAWAVPGPTGDDERARIAAALRETGGNVAGAARRLGMSRTTLRRRIHRHDLAQRLPRD